MYTPMESKNRGSLGDMTLGALTSVHFSAFKKQLRTASLRHSGLTCNDSAARSYALLRSPAYFSQYSLCEMGDTCPISF